MRKKTKIKQKIIPQIMGLNIENYLVKEVDL